ncbi:cation diffusion facilitator family transporter [Sphingomonas sp. H39-1-10]|uniref:cation diffusion facilitator family transporter n=1 Tax=Sphingomonas pollutisoli TaxID=3030829 RepID=UPI0023BA05D4|nr:cation diffusion facilitator family transporter [Sphingomonas pollutisoli]MDF0488274.1 cation diffusion facilitator family transporter [Sphingomonas pollutisoli]
MSGAVPLATRGALASVATACFLLALKGYAAWATGSVAMLGSLADTALDLVASCVTLYGVHLATIPADHDHRYGHGKAEALAALFQVALISVSAAGIAWEAIGALGAPAPTRHAGTGIGVSIAAIIVTLALVAYQRRIIAATGSVAVSADNVHYQSDLLLNGSVIVALVLDQLLHVRGADPVFGVAIALWLAWGALRSAGTAIDLLMDKEWPVAERDRLIALIADHPELRGLHDIRTRRSGTRDFVQFHMYVAPEMTVAAAHEVVEEVEARITAVFPDTEILIHLDPGWLLDARNPLIEPDVMIADAKDRA